MATKPHPVLTEIVEPQVLFDYVIGHMTAQGRPSVATRSALNIRPGQCLYRGSSVYQEGEAGYSCSCAIGCLMTDEEAQGLDSLSSVNGVDIYSLKAHDLIPERLKPHFAFAVDLQHAHDRAAYNSIARPEDFLSSFYDRAASVAEKHQIKLTVPDSSGLPSLQ